MEYLILTSVALIAFSGFGLVLYLKPDKKSGCGCSGKGACQTASTCNSEDRV